MAMPSASSAKVKTETTGPKTSSRQDLAEASFGIRTVGAIQTPGPVGADPLNAMGSSRKVWTASNCFFEISGPISEVASAGSATRNFLTATSKCSMKVSKALFCTRIRVRAQQSWPALSNTALGAEAAAFAISASAKIIFALFPPSSRVTRFT